MDVTDYRQVLRRRLLFQCGEECILKAIYNFFKNINVKKRIHLMSVLEMHPSK